MPTLLASFQQQNRNGTQQTPYTLVPSGIDELHLEGQASAATLSNTADSIVFSILVSPTGVDADAREIQGETWNGGTFTPKGSSTPIPIPIDVAFGPISPYTGQFLAIRATFNRNMNVGATLTALP